MSFWVVTYKITAIMKTYQSSRPLGLGIRCDLRLQELHRGDAVRLAVTNDHTLHTEVIKHSEGSDLFTLQICEGARVECVVRNVCGQIAGNASIHTCTLRIDKMAIYR